MRTAFQWFDFVKLIIRGTRTAHRAMSEGDNRDRLSMVRGETHTLLDVEGPGCITHIWMTAKYR